MSQSQVLDKEPPRSCFRCNRLKADWDKHPLCFLCRPCSQRDTCDVCAAWEADEWTKITRATREYKRKSQKDLDTSASKDEDKVSLYSDEGELDEEVEETSIFTSTQQSGQSVPTDLSGFTAMMERLERSQQSFMENVNKRLDDREKPRPSVKPKSSGAKGKSVPVKKASASVTSRQVGFKVDSLKPKPLDEFSDLDDLSPGVVEDEDLSIHTESDIEDAIEETVEEETPVIDDSDEVLITTDSEIQIMTNGGPIAIPYTIEQGKPAITFQDRIALVAKLAGIQPMVVKGDTDVCGSVDVSIPETQVKAAKEEENETLVLPLTSAVTKAVNNFISPLDKTSASKAQPYARPPKKSLLCSTDPSFYDLPVPSRGINTMSRARTVPTLPFSCNKPSLTPNTLSDVSSVIRDLLSSTSALFYFSQALAQLRAVQFHPRQNKEGLELCALALQQMQTTTIKQQIRVGGYLEAWSTLARRDVYLDSLTRQAADDFHRDLRHAPWMATDTTLFGNKEETIATEYQENRKSFFAQQGGRQSRPQTRVNNDDKKRARSQSQGRSVQFNKKKGLVSTAHFNTDQGQGQSFSQGASYQANRGRGKKPFQEARGGRGGKNRGRGRGWNQ